MHRNRLIFYFLSLATTVFGSLPSYKDNKEQNDLGFGHWNTPILTYTVTRYPNSFKHPRLLPHVMRRHVDNCMREATRIWTPATGVRFIPVDSKEADIKVSFYSSEHGDSYPFDGKGGEVGHTFYPDELRKGHIHLDDDEPWAPDGRNLKWTLAHEMGHALGIPHQKGPSLMELGYRGHQKVELTSIDIEAASKLYKR